MRKHGAIDIRVPIEKDNPSLRRIESFCISCGQCIQVCPTNSVVEKQDGIKVCNVTQEGKKKVIGITSPSVCVGLSKEFGLEVGSYVENQMVVSIRAFGFDYVFDTIFVAYLTIMKKANELVERVKKQEHLPQFTSCCSAWVKFVETYYPDVLNHQLACLPLQLKHGLRKKKK